MDIDIVVIVKSLKLIPKKDWTKIRFEKIIVDGYGVWIAYNSLEGIMNKDAFEKESFANYEWSIIDLKWKQNSQILYGQDIRGMIPDPSNLKIDYDEILSRSLYHLDKSLGCKNRKVELETAKREFTKAVFKFGFYICIFYDNQFHYTSIDNIMLKFNQIKIENFNIKLLDTIFQESIHFRKTKEFVTNFKTLQINFTLLIFALMKKGKLHKTLTFDEFITYLEQKFNGLYNIIKLLKQAKNISHSLKDN